MKRGSQEINDETSPSPTQRLRCREIATVDSIHIPYDLTVEILKKLPTKSLVRFQCVSKQWSSIIGSRRDFIDAIVARSLTQPSRDTHLIFHHRSFEILSKSHFFIFSTTYPQNIDKESVPTLSEMFQYVRGLIFCWSTSETASTIYNPTTKQSLSLPEMEPGYFPEDNRFLGYDPIENQYKVMCIRTNYIGQSYQVFTLGDPTKKWRNIECNIGFHFPILLPVCINGTIYYRALIKGNGRTIVLMSFAVRSEKFCHVEAPKSLMDFSSTLINYQGKLGFMCRYKYSVEIWVMDDAEKKTRMVQDYFL